MESGSCSGPEIARWDGFPWSLDFPAADQYTWGVVVGHLHGIIGESGDDLS
jgi:hypothetical protein